MPDNGLNTYIPLRENLKIWLVNCKEVEYNHMDTGMMMMHHAPSSEGFIVTIDKLQEDMNMHA